MWRTRLNDMRDRTVVVIGRHPYAARINDNNAITYDDAWDMGIRAQHELRITGSGQTTADSVRTIEPRLTRRDIVQKVIWVSSGRPAMASEHAPIQQPRRAGKRPEPFPMVFLQARPRISIGSPYPTSQRS